MPPAIAAAAARFVRVMTASEAWNLAMFASSGSVPFATSVPSQCRTAPSLFDDAAQAFRRAGQGDDHLFGNGVAECEGLAA